MATPFEVLKSQIGVLADPIAAYIAAILADASTVTPPVEEPDPEPEEPPVVTPPVEVPPTLPTTPDTAAVYQIVDYSGGNFVHGVSVKDNAVLVRPGEAIKAGLKLRFKNGQGSIIVSNESVVIAGVTLAKVVVGAITLTEALGAPGSVTLYGMATIPTPTEPTPDPKPPVTPTPNPEPSVQYKNIPLGVNGHEGRELTYPKAEMEARIKLLADNNLKSYRTDVGTGYLDNTTEMNRLIGLCQKYGVILRPMIYPTTEANAYKYAKAYGDRVKVWEIGNEVNLKGKSAAAGLIAEMVATYKGMKRASDELGLGLKFTINVTACNSNYSGASCYGDKRGDIWFLEQAKAAGFNFDYVSFHYYAYIGELGSWYDLYFGQIVAISKMYGAKVFFNEMNAGEIYKAGTTGNEASTANSLRQFLNEAQKYKDYIQEINVYELLDEPNMEGQEAHFGIRTNLATKKPLWDVVTEFALAKIEPPVDASGVYQLGGVNISGLGSNPWVKNAELNTHWRFPSRNFIEAFAKKGIKTFRNPVAIEKFNSAVPQGPLDQSYIDTLGRYLDVLSEFDATCDFEFHNYNRAFVVVDEVDGNQYTGIDSGDANTRNAARAFWNARGKYFPNQFSYAIHYHRKDNKTRLSEWRIIGKAGSRATAGFYDAADQAYLLSQIVPIFKGHKSLQGWGLMNEPFGVDDLMIPNYQLWIDEIRKHDKEKLLYVCGNFYASASSWATSSKGFENLVDSSNKLIYEAHTYPDGNGGGGGKWNNRFEQIPENKIIEQVTPFHDWCVRFGKKGRIGEVGGPKDNPYYIKALENFLNKAQEWNMQVMLWAGGPGWPSDNVTTVQYDVGPGDTKTVPELYANLNPLVNKSNVILTSHKIK